MYKRLWENYVAHGIKGPQIISSDSLRTYLKLGNVALTGDRTDFLNDLRVLGDCDVAVFRETYFPTGFGFALAKGSPYKKHFDTV